MCGEWGGAPDGPAAAGGPANLLQPGLQLTAYRDSRGCDWKCAIATAVLAFVVSNELLFTEFSSELGKL